MPGGEDAGPAAGAAASAGSRGGEGAPRSAARDGTAHNAQRAGSPTASELSGGHSGDSSSSGEEEGGVTNSRHSKLSTVRVEPEAAGCYTVTRVASHPGRNRTWSVLRTEPHQLVWAAAVTCCTELRETAGRA